MISKEVVIIGAGPSGINCAIEASKKNLDYVVLEKGVLVNSLFNFPSNMQFFSTSMNLEIGNIPFISHSDKPTRQEALEYYRRVYEFYNLNIAFRRSVVDVQMQQDGQYLVECGFEKYKTKYLIVATGFYDKPNLLNIPGENLSKVKHYYDEAHHYIGQKIVVIGGANSACDVALETWQKGADVTMVVRQSQLYEKVKYWILPNIQNRIKEGSIRAYFSSELREIRKEFVTIKTPLGLKQIENDYVLAMTGYQPDYAFLKKLGIKIQEDKKRTPAYSESTLETNQKNMFLAGTVLGGLHTSKYFIENTRDQAKTILSAITKRRI